MSVCGVAGTGPLLGCHVAGVPARILVGRADRDAEVGELAVAAPCRRERSRACSRGARPGGGAAAARPSSEPLQHHQRGLRLGGALLADDRAHRDAVDQLHHDRGAATGLEVFVEPGDVGDSSLGEDPRLGPELADETLVAGRPSARYLMATDLPVASCSASTTRPDATAPELPDFGVARNHPFAHRALTPARPYAAVCTVLVPRPRIDARKSICQQSATKRPGRRHRRLATPAVRSGPASRSAPCRRRAPARTSCRCTW